MRQLSAGEIRRKFHKLIGSQDRALFDRMDVLIEKLSSATPSYRMEYGRAAMVVLKLGDLTRDRQEEWLSLAADIEAVLYARGYRSKGDIMTAQEHKLIGSSHAGVNDTRTDRMRYTPLGILTGNLSIDEVRRARELSAVIDNYPFNAYFVAGNNGTRPMKGMLSLEPLDGNSMTMHDPRPIDKEKFEDNFWSRKKLVEVFSLAEIQMEKMVDFPFARGKSRQDDDAPPRIVRDI